MNCTSFKAFEGFPTIPRECPEYFSLSLECNFHFHKNALSCVIEFLVTKNSKISKFLTPYVKNYEITSIKSYLLRAFQKHQNMLQHF
jgi:hypothetical protein